MRKNVAPILPLSVIWNWTCNYLLILYNTDQKGNCNDIILSLFVLKIRLRLKKEKFHKIWNCVFCCWAWSKAWIWTYQRETFINVIFMLVQISIRENLLLTTPWLLEKARLNQRTNVKLTGGKNYVCPIFVFFTSSTCLNSPEILQVLFLKRLRKFCFVFGISI